MSADRPGIPAPIKVMVVDDHPAVREGLALLMSTEGVRMCAEAGNRAEALERVDAAAPTLAIVDLSLDGEDGLPLVAEFKARGVPVLVYSMHNDAHHVEGAFSAGALGYVTKAEFRGVLMEAVRSVAAGRRFVSPKAAVALTERLAVTAPDETLLRLSVKERAVYRLMGKGEGTFEIATSMEISTHTVESYYARIQHKLGLAGMYELRRHAIDHLRQETGRLA